jgi:hypothetical protein
MPLGKIRGAKENPKRHALEDVQASVERFGFGEAPMLDERTGRLVAGHGRIAVLQALKKAGKPPPSGVKATGRDWLVPIQRGWKSRNDAEADGYLLASNKLVESGGWDDEHLAKMIEALQADGGIEGLGFSPGDLAILERNDPSKVEFPEFDEDSIKLNEIECPHCHQKFQRP